MSEETQYDVFLSHNSQDKPAVELLARRLTDEAKLRPFLDKWRLIPGQPWQEALEKALAQSNTVAVFVGPSGISPWHNEEMRAALDNAVRTHDEYRVIPVLLPGATEAAVAGFLARRTWVDFRSGLDDADAFARLVAGILGQPPEQAGPFTLPDEPAPFLGLLPFTAQQADFFFGRTNEQDRLLARVRESPFVAVVGASGSGKSSLVMAGLLPALDRSWHALILGPSARPLRALADQLATLAPPEGRLHLADDLEARLANRADGLGTAVSTLLADRPEVAMLLIVVDQFEELFTQVAGIPEEVHQQRRQFIANLVDAVHTFGGQVRVVLTLRADFVRHCLDYPDLRELLEDNQLLLGPMGTQALREAVAKPAQKVGAMLEKGLLGRLIDDMRDQPAALPLMQFAMAQLWQRRHGAWLTHAAYDAIGGVAGALDQRANAVYNQLTPRQKGLSRNLFVRLVALGDGTSDTRRRVRRDELILVGAAMEEVDEIIGILSHRDVRLIVTHVNTVELAHEALIEQWGQLHQWLVEDREALRIHRRLTEAANEWDKHNQDPSYVYYGTRLTGALEWVGTHRNDLSQLERRFLRASQLRRVRRVAMTVLIPLLMIAVAAFVAAQAQWDILRPLDSGWLSSNQWLADTSQTGLYATSLAADPSNPKLVYAADRSRGSIYRSVDGGQNWENIAGQALKDKVIRVIAIAHADAIYTTTSAGIFRSQDQGASWSLIPSPPLASSLSSMWAITADPENAQRVYVGIWNDGIWMTQDNGSSWTRLESDIDLMKESRIIRALAVTSDKLYAATDTGLFLSVDEGQTWNIVPMFAAENAAILSLAVDESGHLLVGTRGQGVWERTDQEWKLLSEQEHRFTFSVSKTGSFTYIGSSNNGIFHRRIWHWWQPGWWRELFRGEASPEAQVAALASAPPGMVWVPPGEFEMGDREAAQLFYITGFFIDQFEVSWREYCTQMPTDRCERLRPGEMDFPVVDVSWDQTQTYCRTVGKRLPTEAEWEKAARGADGRLFPWGDERPTDDLASLGTGRPSRRGSHPLGQSPFGAAGMTGNVWEIVADGWQPNYFEIAPYDSPEFPADPNRPVIRGGGWSSGDRFGHSTHREKGHLPAPDTGFRCVQPWEVSNE